MNTLHEIIGQSHIKSAFLNAYKSGLISHACILDGEQGLGKMELAIAFAKMLLCENNINGEACGKCSSCTLIDAGNNPDIIITKKTKTRLGVDDIREQVIEKVNLKPFRYKYKIFIINEAHTMLPQAQNALLKTLEEPPVFVFFIILCNNSAALLDTIKSRALTYCLTPLTKSEMRLYIDKNNITCGDDNIIIEYAQGNKGRAKKIAESESFLQMREEISNFLLNINKMDYVEILEYRKEIEKYKDDIIELLDIMLLWYRDLVFAKFNDTLPFIVQKDMEHLIVALAKEYSKTGLFNIMSFIQNAAKNILMNANFNMNIETLLLNIRGETK